jgi:ribosomal subunit interface protein
MIMEIHFKSALSKEDEKEVSKNPTAYAERKIRPLKKYVRDTQEVTQVYVELGKATGAHQSGAIWRAQMNLDSKGQRYHSDATAETLEAAIDKAARELEAELRAAKQRTQTMVRRGGSALKAFMRGFRL